MTKFFHSVVFTTTFVLAVSFQNCGKSMVSHSLGAAGNDGHVTIRATLTATNLEGIRTLACTGEAGSSSNQCYVLSNLPNGQFKVGDLLQIDGTLTVSTQISTAMVSQSIDVHSAVLVPTQTN